MAEEIKHTLTTLSTRSTPHIRLNSGRHEPFVDMEDGRERLRHTLSARSRRSPVPRIRHSTTELTPDNALISPPLASPTESSELLFPPPRKVRSRRGSPDRAKSASVISYRPTSWGSHSDMSRDSRGYPYDLFGGSRSPSHASSEEDNVNTQTVSEKYNIMPTEGLLLFPEDVEKDDYLHNPDPADSKRDCDICNPRGVLNVGGLALLVIGVISLFIIYPVTYVLENPYRREDMNS